MTTEGNIPFGVPASEEVRREAAKPENDPLRPAKGCARGAILGVLCWVLIGLIIWQLTK